MGTLSIWHWLIVALVVLLLFGKGRISEMMGDMAKGIKAFRRGMVEDEPGQPPRQITHQPAPPPPVAQAPAADHRAADHRADEPGRQPADGR